MITGDDLRDYRRRLGLTQIQFTDRLGIPQQTYSNLETGRIQITAERIAQLKDAFDRGDTEPSFSLFLAELQAAVRQRTPALESPLARQVAVTVWRWADFRLDRVMPAEAAVGIVLIPFTDRRVIAVQMDRASQHWKQDEMLVFEDCQLGELDDGDLCLAGLIGKQDTGMTVVIGEVSLEGSAPVPSRMLRVDFPKKSSVPLEAPQVQHLMRAVARMTYRQA